MELLISPIKGCSELRIKQGVHITYLIWLPFNQSNVWLNSNDYPCRDCWLTCQRPGSRLMSPATITCTRLACGAIPLYPIFVLEFYRYQLFNLTLLVKSNIYTQDSLHNLSRSHETCYKQVLSFFGKYLKCNSRKM